MSEREEALLESAFVLHSRAFRNTSLILDCITPDHGRVGLVSRGARRSRGGNRALLQPFTELRISWVRRGELGQLTQVEPTMYSPPLGGDGLFAGFYINELLLRLVARGDANPGLFADYRASLAELCRGDPIARTVRRFELGLLDAVGYRVELGCDWRSGHAIEAGRHYVFELESGLTEARSDQVDHAYPGEHLISLREGRLDDAGSLRTARRLLGKILDSYVGDRPLRSREVMYQMMGVRRSSLPETVE